MDYFDSRKDGTFCEDTSLAEIAEQHGTPCFVYSQKTLARHCENFLNAFKDYPTTACFAVKANSSVGYLREVFRSGLGADIVSIGELERSLLAGVAPEKIVFSGVGKRDDEILRALEAEILSFNVESAFELDVISELAAQSGRVARVSLRINPNIDAQTHAKISTGLHTTKFGITTEEAKVLFNRIKENRHLELVGLACHIGSQILDLGPLKQAGSEMARLAIELKKEGFDLKLLNMGGGLGIKYKEERPPDLADYADALIQEIKPTGLQLIVEPGRVIAGNTGVLVTRVIGVKRTPQKTFVIVDAAMTELVRPAFYGSYHDILPVQGSDAGVETFDIVGPVCESSDVLGVDRKFSLPERGDLLYIRACGGYGATMASNYNSRPRPEEVLVNGSKITVIKQREPLARLWELENV